MFHIAIMRFTAEQLTYKALCALSEVAEACHTAPVKPSMTLRFILAYLYATYGKGDRSIYDGFWKVIQSPMEFAHSDENARYMRRRDATSFLTVMVRHAGFPETPAFFESLRDSHTRNSDGS